MRARYTVLLLVLAAAACAHDDHHAQAPGKLPEARAATTASVPPVVQYLVADPGPKGPMLAVPLGSGGALGIVVDKARIVAGRGEPRVATELTEATIGFADKLPARFGGGFVFIAESSVYRADTFDGPLKPVARLPESVADFSFAPKGLLLRTQNGERWSIALPSGDRFPITPVGAADVEALDDGRALAFDDQGAAFTSTDGGVTWNDITAQVRGTPERVRRIDEELWLLETGGGALRLEADGRLSAFDKPPPDKPILLRAKDARWRGDDSPLRAVFHGGAAIDDSTAVVVESGDLVHVDVHTGEIVAVVAGKLPPDARCEAVPIANDVLFACRTKATPGNPYGNGNGFVVSHTIGNDAPQIEQTFSTPGFFYASDDGGLAYGGPCAASATSAAQAQVPQPALPTSVCVRQAGGTWEELDVSTLVGDAGATAPTVARWVPRADGRVVALVVEPTPGIYDPRSGSLVTIPPEMRDVLGPFPRAYAYHKRMRAIGIEAEIVDWGWSFSPNGGLRGWNGGSGGVEISEDGRVTKSPYAFEVVASGPFGLGRSHDGRLYQSTDHGATWAEVAAPPSGASGADLHGCSSAGCDLGGFYRVGWIARSPHGEAVPKPADPAPAVRRSRALELACRPAGPPQAKTLPRTERSPDDLGLGNVRVGVADDKGEVAFVRNTVPRGIMNPLHETSASDTDTPALRAMLTGYATQRDADVITVVGPNKNAASLRRALGFVAAFDPGATVRRATISMSDVLTAGRAVGMATDEILQDDMTETGDVIPVTPVDPNAPGDLAFHSARGLLAHVRSGERVRVGIRPPQNDGVVVSGAATSADEAAFLELETAGLGHVFRMGAGGVTDLFDVGPISNEPLFYPANPDAVAIGPHGEVGILRTPSGSDPPSANDPALVVVPSSPPVALAPWSTVRFADDPSCKSEAGWRATLQVIAPWIRTTTPDLRVEEAPMLARVKWNDKRVCLEGFEVKLPNASVRSRQQTGFETLTVSTWLVARGSSFARVSVGEGYEWRQPLECNVVGQAQAQALTPHAP